MNHLMLGIRSLQPHSGKIRKLSSKLQTINIKAGKSYNYKVKERKFKYKSSVVFSKIFFTVIQGREKVCE